VNFGFGEEPSLLARRLIGAYILIMLTCVVVLQGVSAIRLSADNRSDIQRNTAQAELIRVAQFDNCQRSRELAEGLHDAIETILLDPDTGAGSSVELRRGERQLNREPCVTVALPEE
jgi:hypothetical protein